jgi:transcriptional regulator with XRE-family HTH domain
MNVRAQDLGHTLHQRRLKLGMTQAQVADLTGKKQTQIYRLERGLVDPRLSTMSEIARSLGMEIVAVPLRLLPAVKHLIQQEDGSAPAHSRLVGNDPEDLEDPEADDDEF